MTMRVFELARELGCTTKDIIQLAAKEGLTLKSHMVTVPADFEPRVRAAFPKSATPVAASPSAPAAPAAPAASKEKPVKKKEDVTPVQSKAQPVVPAVPVTPAIPPAAVVPAPTPVKAAAPVQPATAKSAATTPPKPVEKPATAPKAPMKKLSLPFPLRVVDLAKNADLSVAEVVSKLMNMGMMMSANALLDKDSAQLVAQEFGYDLTFKEVVAEAPTVTKKVEEKEDPKDLQPRPPVVVVMGHVDHGKTSLLDYIRKAQVAAGEFGGITQHIGAYKVHLHGKDITFLDTPGHEAFTAMRARGANVTDIAVLVVAADDGIMPQTVEAISHARAAGVPIIVALNKIDRPDCDKQRVLKQLSDHGLNPEAWGGDTIVAEVSALKGTGIETLLEMIELQAEMLGLKANPNRAAVGTVIESKLDRGRGPTATVLIQKGTLRVGDIFVCGSTYGRIKALIDEFGKRMDEAGPSTPAEILGFEDVPDAGDNFNVVTDERSSKDIAEERGIQKKDMAKRKNETPLTLDAMTENLREGEKTILPLLLKTDVQGSLEAIKDALERLRSEEVPILVLHAALGGITESDVLLAAASHATVLGFNVRPDDRAVATAAHESVDVRTYRIIYDLLNDVKKAVTGRMAPRIEQRVIATVEVRNTFRITKVGQIAGCFVKEGKVERRGRIRVVRSGVVVYEGRIASLKRFKDDVREVEKGYECGIFVENFNDIKVGDILEIFLVEELAPTL